MFPDSLCIALDRRKGQETEQNLLDMKESEFMNEFSRMEKYLLKKDIAQRFTELFTRYESALAKRTAINQLLENFKQEKIDEKTTDDKLIRVIQEPSTSSPIKPRRKRMIMMSGFLSLILGFFLALIVDFIKRGKASSQHS